jgi:peptidoglycan/xylan/chitin deacetylase (PgdA/CDA1 family)
MGEFQRQSATGGAKMFRRRAKSLAREAALASLGLLGRPAGVEGPAVILCYHSHTDGDRWGTPVERFARQLAYVLQQWRLVRLDDLGSHIGTGQGPVMCLTFDDGSSDNHDLTLPLLERYGVKATFFLITSSLGSGKGIEDNGHRMSSAQAKELAALGHEIGSHTVSHLDLTSITAREARREIEDSKKALEDELEVAVTSFAYPKGKHDSVLQEIVREAGYRQAVTTREAPVTTSANWFALPRLSVTWTVGMAQFRGKLSRAFLGRRTVAGR